MDVLNQLIDSLWTADAWIWNCRKSSISLKSPREDADSRTLGLMARKMHKVVKSANEFKSRSWYQQPQISLDCNSWYLKLFAEPWIQILWLQFYVSPAYIHLKGLHRMSVRVSRDGEREPLHVTVLWNHTKHVSILNSNKCFMNAKNLSARR